MEKSELTFLVQDIQLPNELNFPDVLLRALVISRHRSEQERMVQGENEERREKGGEEKH